MDYEYGARVIEKESDNIYIVEIKNKLSLGDRLEILRHDSFEECSFIIQKLYDIKNNEQIETINPGIKGQLVKIEIPFDIAKGTVIRRKK